MRRDVNKEYRQRFEQFIQRKPENAQQQQARIGIANSASDVHQRLRGHVPLMDGSANGLPTHVDEASNTLFVYTSNSRHTHQRVMEAIWSVVPNCPAIRVQVRYCGKEKNQ